MAQTADYHLLQREQRNEDGADLRTPLMTPARRAALDALEREFYELLGGRQANAA